MLLYDFYFGMDIEVEVFVSYREIDWNMICFFLEIELAEREFSYD